MIFSKRPFFCQIAGEIHRHHETRSDEIYHRKVDDEHVIRRVKRAATVERQNRHQIPNRSDNNVKGSDRDAEKAKRLDRIARNIRLAGR